MTSKLEKKLQNLPKEPGVYQYKDATGEIIYIGKAAILRNRVKQYFQKGRPLEAKTKALVSEIADIDWITVESEIDALFLEAELVRRYLPRYNILLRDDKSTVYVRIDYKSNHPTVTLTRRPLDDGAEYFGPYFAAGSVRKALHYLRRAFPYSTHARNIPRRACLQYHLGLCPGLEENKTSLADYRQNLKKLIQYLKGERSKLIREIEKEMNAHAKASEFEKAAHARNQLFALKGLSKQIIFSDKEFLDISKDQGLVDLAKLLGLAKAPRRIEGYDISHMSGTNNVASMVVFTNGVPHKAEYRKFKMRLPGNDDFAHMNEVITRRLSFQNPQEGLQGPALQTIARLGLVNTWKRQIPDLILIDGGKGQLNAAMEARDAAGYSHIPMIGLAKREEEIVVKDPNNSQFTIHLLPKTSHAVKLLQRIRDESHRFAVSYHTVLKRQKQTASSLEELPGIGPATRKKLIKHFGSLRAVSQASENEIANVVGASKAKMVYKYVKS
jgi:excinuclease ABC subunit C